MNYQDMSAEELQAAADELMERWGMEDAGSAYLPAKMVAAVDGDRIVINVMGAKEAPAIAKMSTLEGQIIAAVMPRNLWLSKDSPRPACSSPDSRYGRLDPEQVALMPFVIPDGQECKLCPYDQWQIATDELGNPKRDANGRPKMTKLCKVRRTLLLLSADFNEPIIISVATKSVKNWDAYADGFGKKRKHFAAFITQITAEEVREGRDSYGVMKFNMVRALDPVAVVQAADLRPQYMPMLVAPQVALIAAGIEGTDEGKTVSDIMDDAAVEWGNENAQPPQPF